MTEHPDLRARVESRAAELEAALARAKSAATSRAGAMIARLGRNIAAYPILATGVAFGAGYALIRRVRR